MPLDLLNANAVRVAAYLVGGALASGMPYGLPRGRRSQRLEAFSWVSFAIILVVLGFARVVDLGPWITSVGRHEAEIEGWYDERREVQTPAAMAVAGATVVAALCLLALTLLRAPRLALPSTVLVLLLGFLGIRAISLHHVDAALYQWDVSGLSLNAACELGLLLAFSGSCLVLLLQARTIWRGQ